MLRCLSRVSQPGALEKPCGMLHPFIKLLTLLLSRTNVLYSSVILIVSAYVFFSPETMGLQATLMQLLCECSRLPGESR